MGLGAYLVTDQESDDVLWNGYALADDDIASVAEFGEVDSPEAFLNEDGSGETCWFDIDKGLSWLSELRAIVLRVANECERQSWADVDEEDDDDDDDDEEDDETPRPPTGPPGFDAESSEEDEFGFGELDDDNEEDGDMCHGPRSLADVADDVNLETLEAVVTETDELAGWLKDLAGEGARWALELE